MKSGFDVLELSELFKRLSFNFIAFKVKEAASCAIEIVIISSNVKFMPNDETKEVKVLEKKG